MRLIDADKFKQQIAGIAIANNLRVDKCNALCELIDKQPTIGDRDITPEMARAAYNVMRKYAKMQKANAEIVFFRMHVRILMMFTQNIGQTLRYKKEGVVCPNIELKSALFVPD